MKKPPERTDLDIFLADYLPWLAIFAGFAYAAWMWLTYGALA